MSPVNWRPLAGHRFISYRNCQRSSSLNNVCLVWFWSQVTTTCLGVPPSQLSWRCQFDKGVVLKASFEKSQSHGDVDTFLHLVLHLQQNGLIDGMTHLSDLLFDPSHLVVHFFQFGPDSRNVVAFQGLKLGEENWCIHTMYQLISQWKKYFGHKYVKESC